MLAPTALLLALSSSTRSSLRLKSLYDWTLLTPPRYVVWELPRADRVG